MIFLFTQAGVINPVRGRGGIDDIAQLLWLVGDFWLVFKDTGGSRSSARPTANKASGCSGASSPHTSKDNPNDYPSRHLAACSSPFRSFSPPASPACR